LLPYALIRIPTGALRRRWKCQWIWCTGTNWRRNKKFPWFCVTFGSLERLRAVYNALPSFFASLRMQGNSSP
jgi:hypothetical protein